MNYPSIKFIYEYPSQSYANGVIKLEIDHEENNNINFPLTFQVIGLIDNKIYWENRNMKEGHWASYTDACNKKVLVIDSNNNIIKEWIWNQEEHGDKIHKDFYNWCLLNKGANGISIGTHDGTTGEWVSPIREKLINGYLVEPSDMQFKDLCNNYKNCSNVNLIQKLITKDGGNVDFFEGGGGFMNSVNKEFILKFHDETLIKKVQKQSVSLNQLIIDCGLKDDLDWLHMDVESIDDQLIMSLDDKLVKLPDIIIYEDLNLSEERKNKLKKWLENKNYKFYHSGFNTMAKKQPIKVSVIIPCYNYSKYVEQCLMSVMLQNIDFNIEVLISDDNSSDGSFNVIKRFFENYKKDNIFFKIYSQDKNIGEINNTKFLLENSNGEYIAYLDADDFWIDPDKLKKQVEFMDNNLDHSLCLAGYYRIENDEYSNFNFNEWSCPTDINGLNSKSLTKYNIVGSSSSRFFRNYKNLVKNYFYEFPFSDWPLNFELSLKGKIGYLDYPSYIYRIHENSLSKRAEKVENVVNEKRILILESFL